MCHSRWMDRVSLTMNIASLSASVAALVTSAVIAIRQVKTAHRANQVPMIVEIFRFMRSRKVRRMEEMVKAELPNHDPQLGFRNLPEPLRSNAHEVSSNFNEVVTS